MYLELRGKDALVLKVMSDSDWAGDPIDRKSTSGQITFLGRSPVAWSSRKQKCTANSSFHAELVALYEAAKDGAYLKEFASSILSIEVPLTLYCDNEAARMFASSESGHFTKAAKHIELR